MDAATGQTEYTPARILYFLSLKACLHDECEPRLLVRMEWFTAEDELWRMDEKHNRQSGHSKFAWFSDMQPSVIVMLPDVVLTVRTIANHDAAVVRARIGPFALFRIERKTF